MPHSPPIHLDILTRLFDSKEANFIDHTYTIFRAILINRHNKAQEKLKALIMLLENEQPTYDTFNALHSLIGKLSQTKEGLDFLSTNRERVNKAAEKLLPPLVEDVELNQFLRELGSTPTTEQRRYLIEHLDQLLSFEESNKLRDFFSISPSFFQGSPRSMLHELHEKLSILSEGHLLRTNGINVIEVNDTRQEKALKVSTLGINLTSLYFALKPLFEEQSLPPIAYFHFQSSSSPSVSINSTQSSSTSSYNISNDSIASRSSSAFFTSAHKRMNPQDMPILVKGRLTEEEYLRKLNTPSRVF